MSSSENSKAAVRQERSAASIGEAVNGTFVSGSAAAEDQHRWTFLTNHSHVLLVLYENPDIVLREVAQRVGITERAVQRIVQDLEDGGFIERKRVGRCNHYRVLTDTHLRHPLESHCKVSQLLELIVSTNAADEVTSLDSRAIG